MNDVARARPAATVILLRDGDSGLETLLVERNRALSFHGGDWAFPGGALEVEDGAPGLEAARRAAARELAEEVDLQIDEASLAAYSRWIAPDVLPKRFDAWYFVARAPDVTPRADGSELVTCRFVRPRDAVDLHARGSIGLPPPTFVTLVDLSRFESTEHVLHYAHANEAPCFYPRIVLVGGQTCSLYHGDAGYEAQQPEAPGARHRLWMTDRPWRYERA
jgi:8-oxo-dGTP pyrophosphatase MutT (NUDIX family)